MATYDEPMGFGRESKRVRDASLPLGPRFRALGSWIQLAQPIAFEPTWAYLEAKLDCSWREPDFLLPAMDLLEAEREAHLRLESEYAELRKLQKAAGRRSPSRDEVTPTQPRRWHGDEQAGARYSLEAWLRIEGGLLSATDSGRKVRALIEEALDSSTPPEPDFDELQSILDWARHQIHVVGWETDPATYRIAGAIHRALGHLYLLVLEVPPVGNPWNFRSA